MYVFSGRVSVPPGSPLGGYGRRGGSTDAGELEIHGLGIDAGPGGRPAELCSVDALYAGALAKDAPPSGTRRILAATHTHTAPMLDGGKPLLAPIAGEALAGYRAVLEGADRRPVHPDRCTVHQGEVSLPVYRRFDHPDTALNRALAGRAGLFPNPAHPVDRAVRIFVLSRGEEAQVVLVHHACHPVTRHDLQRVSPDYVGSIRAAVAERFGGASCLFLLGCAGDIRPDFSGPRVKGLPRSRLNWRFRWPPSPQDQARADQEYGDAIRRAREVERFPVQEGEITWCERRIDVSGLGTIVVPEVRIGEHVAFAFLPFEVSHRYHLDAQSRGSRTLIVSCADDTRGYLPHPTQLRAGGYEVDGSRAAMGLPHRVSWGGTFT